MLNLMTIVDGLKTGSCKLKTDHWENQRNPGKSTAYENKESTENADAKKRKKKR